MNPCLFSARLQWRLCSAACSSSSSPDCFPACLPASSLSNLTLGIDNLIKTLLHPSYPVYESEFLHLCLWVLCSSDSTFPGTWFLMFLGSNFPPVLKTVDVFQSSKFVPSRVLCSTELWSCASTIQWFHGPMFPWPCIQCVLGSWLQLFWVFSVFYPSALDFYRLRVRCFPDLGWYLPMVLHFPPLGPYVPILWYFLNSSMWFQG